MSFMNFFQPRQQQPANTGNSNQGGNNTQVAGNNNQQQQQNPNMPQGNGNPTGNGNGNGGNANNQQQVNPLDTYSKLFDNPQQSDADKPPTFSIDPKIMDEVVGSQDFMKGINPELMQKAMSGDFQAMMEIMQTVGRNSYRASIEHGGVLTDKFVGAREQFSNKGLSGRVRQELTTHALSSTPNFQHPVVKKQLTEIAQRFQAQHPDATPQEIAEMSKKYLNDLVGALNPNQGQDNQQAQKQAGPRGEEFWNDFFDKDDSDQYH